MAHYSIARIKGAYAPATIEAYFRSLQPLLRAALQSISLPTNATIVADL